MNSGSKDHLGSGKQTVPDRSRPTVLPRLGVSRATGGVGFREFALVEPAPSSGEGEDAVHVGPDMATVAGRAHLSFGTGAHPDCDLSVFFRKVFRPTLWRR